MFKKNTVYTYFPDFNGNFIVLNKNAENSQIEADYSWVYFTLNAPDFFDKEEIYVIQQVGREHYTKSPKFYNIVLLFVGLATLGTFS